MQRQVTTALALLLAMTAAPAFAESKLTIDMKSEKDAVVIENGKQVTKLIETNQAAPGEVIHYVFNYRSVGDEVVRNVEIPNKVPEGTTYVANSAKGEVEAMFSIDGGKTFARPSELTIQVTNAKGEKETVVAPPEKYTDIRWLVPQVPAGKSGQVSYAVRVK